MPSDRPAAPLSGPPERAQGGAGLAYAALTAASLFWAGNFIVARAVRGEIEPIALNGLRWLLALAVFAPLIWPTLRAAWPALRRAWPMVVLQGAAGIALFQTALYAAVYQAEVVDVALLVPTAPALILLGDAALRRTPPSRIAALGVAASMLGALVLLSRGDLARLTSIDLNPGQLWMALAVTTWAAYTLMLRRTPADLHPQAALAGGMAAGLALMAPFALESLWRAPPDLSQPSLIGAILYVGLFAGVGALAAYSFGVARIGPVRAGQFLNLTPVFGALLAILLLGERLRPDHAVGAALIGLGLWLVNRRAAEPPPAPPR